MADGRAEPRAERPDGRRHARSRIVWALCALSLLGCGERGRAPAGPEHGASTCPAPTLDVPRATGFPTAQVVETHARVLVQHDVDPHACLVGVAVRRESMLFELTFEGTTYRARLAASLGIPQEGIADHVVAQRRMRGLLDADVTTAISNARGVALGFRDHGAVCRRSAAAPPSCVRTPAVLAFDSITEPGAQQLVVDALSDAGASEWELTFGETTTLTARTGTLTPARALGEPPPDPDRFADVRSASPEQSSAPTELAAVSVASQLPTMAATVRLETLAVAGTRVAILQRCDGLVPHCVTVIAAERDGAWIFAPSFANDPARVDRVDDASALASGAIAVRLIEGRAQDRSARDVFLVLAGNRYDAYDVPLGAETLRGEGDTATQGCYRSLAIEGASRVRLSGAQGWSGTHTARGWTVAPSPTCAADATLCLDTGSGFGTCS